MTMPTVRRLWMLLWIAGLLSPVPAAEETWTEVRSPHFVVVSDATLKQARRTARLFEQYRLLIQTAMVSGKVDPPIPLTVFAARDERSFHELLGEERQKRGGARRAGWFLDGGDHQLVALRIDAPGDQTFHVIFHEYVHLITKLTYGELPLWLQEGLAEFFAYTELSRDLAYLGKVDHGVISYLRSHPLMPLETLFEVKRDSPYYREQDKTTAFYHNSWALVHYLMIEDRRQRQNRLTRYIEMIRGGVPETEAATRAFGDLKALEKALSEYIHLPTTAYYEVPASLTVDEEEYQTRPLSRAESLGYRGDLLACYQKPDRARELLDQALSADPRNARANEAMGRLFLRLNDQAQAGKYFLAAAELDTRSCTANYFAARALNRPGDDSDRAEKYLRRAIEIDSEFAPAYGELAQLLRRKSKLPEALACARKLESLQPGVLGHKINVASLLAEMKQIDKAFEYGRLISALARDERDRQAATSFLNWITTVRDNQLALDRMRDLESERQRARELREVRSAGDEPFSVRLSAPRSQPPAEPQGMGRLEEISRLAGAERGPSVRIEGIVQSVVCATPEILDLTLDAGGVSKSLFSDRHSAIRFSSGKAVLKNDFQPCRDLAGKRVDIEYQIVTGGHFSGAIKAIEVRR